MPVRINKLMSGQMLTQAEVIDVEENTRVLNGCLEYYCAVCKKRFSTIDQVLKHALEHHGTSAWNPSRRYTVE